MRSGTGTTRRRATRALAGTALTAVAGCIKVNTSPVSQPGGGKDDTLRFRLVGRTAAWRGREPGAIEGVRNPTLELEPGVDVVLTWVNADGERHRFVVADSSGEPLVTTEATSTEGATRTVEFTARQEMVEFFCEFHPAKMRGTVLVSDR